MPERMCILTREVRHEAQLIRFVQSPDGLVVPDLLRKLPGRGVWVSADRVSVAEVVKRNLFSRGFGGQASPSPDLPDLVQRLLRQQAVATLSLARKAGQALAGFIKVETALHKQKVQMLLHAPGCGADGTSKLNRLAGPETLISSLLTAAELDLAFGRTNVVHAALIVGGVADKLVFCMRRVAAYEAIEFSQSPGTKD